MDHIAILAVIQMNCFKLCLSIKYFKFLMFVATDLSINLNKSINHALKWSENRRVFFVKSLCLQTQKLLGITVNISTCTKCWFQSDPVQINIHSNQKVCSKSSWDLFEHSMKFLRVSLILCQKIWQWTKIDREMHHVQKSEYWPAVGK